MVVETLTYTRAYYVAVVTRGRYSGLVDRDKSGYNEMNRALGHLCAYIA